MEKKKLEQARAAKEIDNDEEAWELYKEVLYENPNNGEANFFCTYYDIYNNVESDIARKLDRLSDTAFTSIKQIIHSNNDSEEKSEALTNISSAYTALIAFLLNNRTDYFSRNHCWTLEETKYISKQGILDLYKYGDAIENYAHDIPNAMVVASFSWEIAISLQQKFHSVPDNTLSQKYINKIKSVNPDYQAPQSGGCFTSSTST